jgi:flagellar motor switch protein FliN/FliY
MSSNISQEEINAMLGLNEAAAEETEQPADLASFLSGGSGAADDSVRDVSDYLTPEEVDLLGEIGNICMGAVATTMYSLLDRRVSITTPRVEVYLTYEVMSVYKTPFVIVDVRYVEGIEGKNVLMLKEQDALLITDLLMGGEGLVEEGTELSEIHMSAISEIMNQMIGASATSLSNMLGRAVNISPPVSEWIDANSDVSGRLDSSELVVKISFDMEIEGLLKSQLLQLMPYQMGKDMAQKMMEVQRKDTEVAAALKPSLTAPPPAPAADPPAATPPAPTPPAPAPAPAMQPSPPPPPAYAPPAYAAPAKLVDVSPASYPAFDSQKPAEAAGGKGLDMVADIPLQVSVELGKTKKTISEILEFGLGTIVVLEKTAGEHVEVLVNGKLIANGEVVVIDENYGVRITEIFE